MTVLTFRLAWRNLWRNRRRTFINLTAGIVSTMTLIVSFSLVQGLAEQLRTNVTELSFGEAQVHNPEYRGDRSIHAVIENPTRVLRAARASDIDAAPRALGYGLASKNDRSAGVQVIGVDPPSERSVGRLPQHLRAGEFLSTAPNREIVVGHRLARSLNATVGDELVLLVQAADGSTGSELFVIRGILAPVGEMLDRTGAFIHASDFSSLYSTNGIHEIALSTHGRVASTVVASTVASAAADLETLEWEQLLPVIADLLSLFEVMTWIMSGVFFVAGGLGVLNTMLMSTFERIPEFGLVKALGASGSRIIGEVVAEGFWLGLIVSVVGGTVGTSIAVWVAQNGIDVSSFGHIDLGGMSVDPLWHGKLTVSGIVQPILTMWAVAFIAALIPAVRAAKLDPVRALAHV